ncbi:hypothetical protein BDN67DRAFT_984693 [Paxillus ammoniavirescens]|nr:hypothetical protein BDN67DRAFT_984693 [Paxillus ammoniavirescens]
MSTIALAAKVYEGSALVPGSTSLRDTAHAFLCLIITSQLLMPDTCDLLDGSFIKQYHSSLITMERRAGKHFFLDGGHTQKTYYLIRPCQLTTDHFVIFLDDPALVIQVIHKQWNVNPSNIAVQLASGGIPFSTRILNDTVLTLVNPCCIPLGFLLFQYCPHSSDYAAYLEKQNKLL